MIRIEHGIVADKMEFFCAVIAVHVKGKQIDKVKAFNMIYGYI